MSSSKRLRLVIGAILAGTVVVAIAPTRSFAASESSAESPDTLSDIVVTAQRRAESVEKVPLSMTAISNKDLEELHVQSFSDLVALVPGLVLSTTAATFQSSNDIAIRGIFSGGNSATTAVYIDETPITIRRIDLAAGSGSPSPDIFDLERVEVLRGPQGTLFGSSAMGGAIRYITPQPSLDAASGYAKAEFGYTDRGDPSYAAGVAYGAPIVQGTAGFRVSAWYHTDGGFIDIQDPYTGAPYQKNRNVKDTYAVRPAFTWAPTENLTITPAVFFQHFHSLAPDTYWLTFIPNPEAGKKMNGDLVPQPQTDNVSVSSLAIKDEMSWASFASDSSYYYRKYQGDDDWTHWWAPIFGGGPFLLPKGALPSSDLNLISTKAWQQEFRLSSKDPNSRFTWVAGAFYRHATQVSSQLINRDLTPLTEALAGVDSLTYFGVPNYIKNGQVLNSYTYYSTLDESKALFGEVTFAIAPRLKANVGVRVERQSVKDQHQINAGPLLGLTYSDKYAPDVIATPVTPRAGLTYQYTDQDMVYATAAKGYRAGGSNAADATENPLCLPPAQAYGLSSVPLDYKSDSLWSYEIGAKDAFFDRRLVVQASVYYVNWTNIQTPLSLSSCAETVTANRGKAISRGFDLQIGAVPLEGMKVSANVGYTDAYFPNAAYGGLVNGVPALLNGAGDKLQYVVPWTVALHGDYSRPIGNLWSGAKGYLRADWRWQAAAPSLDPLVANYDPAIGPNQNPAYGILNLRVGVLHEGLDVSVFVMNATRADPRLGYEHVVPGDPLYEAVAQRPITVGLTTLFRF